MTDDTTKWPPAWPLEAGVSGLDENGRLTEEAAEAIANAATGYAIAIRDGKGFPHGTTELMIVIWNGFQTYWTSVHRAFRAGVPDEVFERDSVDEDIGLGPDGYSRSTEEARQIWGMAFARMVPRIGEPA